MSKAKHKLPKSPDYKPFRWRLILFLSLFISTICFSGIWLYSDLTKMVNDQTENTQPGSKIYLLKDVQNNLQSAENMVFAYSIYKDDKTLFDYYKTIENIQLQLDTLESHKTETHTLKLDSINNWLSELLIIWDKSIRLESNLSIDIALDNLIEKLATEKEFQSGEKQNNILKRLFNSRKKTENTISNQLTEFEKNESATLKKMQQDRLFLFNESKLLLKLISKEIKQAEELEYNKLLAHTKNSNQLSKSISNRLFWIGIVLLMVIAFTVYSIVNFINKEKSYRSALRKTQKEALKLNAAKEQFLASVSHEIRTPLHALLNNIEKVKEAPNEKNLKLVELASQQLKLMVNDVLDYSKLAAGELTLETHPTNIKNLLARSRDLFLESAKKKGLKLDLSVNNLTHHWYLLDEKKLSQIVNNLLNNAIKFTHNGFVKIDLAKDSNNQFKLKIEDSGEGIDSQFLPDLFKDFTQSTSSINNQVQGTGLGLSIVKSLCDLMQANIEVNSIINKGSTFTITFSAETCDEPQPEKTKTKLSHEINLGEKKILVADDDPFNRELLDAIFKKTKAQVVITTNGQEAYEASKQQPFDYAFIDLQMPFLGGLDLMEKWQQDKSISPKNTVLMSASITKENQTKFISKGYQEVLSKPFSEQDVLNLFGSFKVGEVENSSEINLMGLLNMLDGNLDTLTEMTTEFSNNLKEGVQSIIRLDEDSDKAQEIAHKLAPSCKHLNANSMYDLLKDIEKNWNKYSLAKRKTICEELIVKKELVIKAINQELNKLKP